MFLFRGHNGVRSCVDCLQTDVRNSPVDFSSASLWIYYLWLVKPTVFSPAGHAPAPGRDRTAVGENLGGASRSEQLYVRGAKDPGLGPGPERGPRRLPAPPGSVPAGPSVCLLASRGRASGAWRETEGTFVCRLCSCSELTSDLWPLNCVRHQTFQTGPSDRRPGGYWSCVVSFKRTLSKCEKKTELETLEWSNISCEFSASDRRLKLSNCYLQKNKPLRDIILLQFSPQGVPDTKQANNSQFNIFVKKADSVFYLFSFSAQFLQSNHSCMLYAGGQVIRIPLRNFRRIIILFIWSRVKKLTRPCSRCDDLKPLQVKLDFYCLD